MVLFSTVDIWFETHEPKTVSRSVSLSQRHHLTTSSTLNGGLVVEHPTSNREVLGSNPTLIAACI